jgi:hypothetical protein
MRAMRQRPIFEIGITYEFAFNQATSTVCSHQSERVIGRAGIRHDDFIGHLPRRGNAIGNMQLLIFANDEYGKGRHGELTFHSVIRRDAERSVSRG